MATIKITSVKCIRKQDIIGLDEPRIYLGGLQVWEGKMGKGDSKALTGVQRTFSDDVLVELREQNNNRSEKELGKWTVSDTPTPAGNPPLTASTSGYHYEVYFDVLAA